MSKSQDKETEENKETDAPRKKTLGLSGKGTLSLKTNVSAPRQSSGGSPGSVAVEVKRKRVPTPSEQTTPDKDGQSDDAHLTSHEKSTRAEALKKALSDGEKRRTTLPKRRTPQKPAVPNEVNEDKSNSEPQTQREKELAELQQIQESEALSVKEQQELAAQKAGDSVRRGRVSTLNTEKEESYRDKIKKTPAKPRTPSGYAERTRRITVNQALNRDYERDRGPSLAAQKRAKQRARMAARGSQEAAKKIIREVTLPEVISVAELANRMAEPAGDVVKELMKLGVMATITQTIDADTAELVIDEMGHKLRRVTDADIEIGIEGIQDTEENLKPRPPVVTIMGHVDHGKTSLLDSLRKTNVVSGEAGGITQHIGAYQINDSAGNKITFLDTPGHAAFTEMRARGANVTDIVVIVVAADDSIMPQTIEAINHAKAAEVPIIIAVNKIDLPAADPMKVKTQLLQHEVIVEELSGEVQCIEISALKGTNLDKLEEAILLQSEILELKANPNREAHGVVVESKLEQGRGNVATVLIQKGTLRVGDTFVAGAEYGKIRALINDQGETIEAAIPGQPVEVLGLNGPPESGDSFLVIDDETKAREVSEYRQRKRREKQAALAVKGRTTIDDLIAQKEEGEKTVLHVLIKADVHGSVEALAGSLQKMVDENDDIDVHVLHTGVGGITESDVALAKASNAMIIGFNVRANAQARGLAQQEGINIRYYNVIYNVVDDAKAILSGMLSPKEREEYIGQAKILQVFNITKVGKVAGCVVEAGMVKRGSRVRLLRDDVVIHENGTLKTLKRHQDEVKEVKEGTECGMAFENYDDLKEGDVIECYDVIEEARVVS